VFNYGDEIDTGLLTLLGFLWPPLGFKLRIEKHDREERVAFIEWYREVVIPYWTKQYPKERIAEFERPMVFKKIFNNKGELR